MGLAARATSDERPTRASYIEEGGDPPQYAQNLILVYVDDPPPWPTHSRRHGITGQPSAIPDSATSALLPQLPFLASLAAEGVTFLDGRNAPVCSPGRASWMTGTYAFRHGVGHVVKAGVIGEGGYSGGGLNEFGDPGYAMPTVFTQLRAAGIHTGWIGKAHFSAWTSETFDDGSDTPGTGFEVMSRVGDIDYMAVTLRNLNQHPIPGVDAETEGTAEGSYYRYYTSRSASNETLETDWVSDSSLAPYHTTWMVDEAITFLSTVPAGKRFFLYLPFCAVHSPYGSPSDLDRDFPPEGLVNTAEYYAHKDEATTWHPWMAAMEALDTELARMWASMTPQQRRETTIVVMPDNGIEQAAFLDGFTGAYAKNYGPDWTGLFESGEGRLKTSTYHWGTWMGPIWRGPRAGAYTVVDPGRESNIMVDIPDVGETICDYFGTSLGVNSIDGVSFLEHAQTGVGTRSTHARQQQYSEIFFPLGDHLAITTGQQAALGASGASAQTERKEHSMLQDLADPVSGGTSTFHFRRYLLDGVYVEELYRHAIPSDVIASEVEVDRWEAEILDPTAYAAIYTAMRDALDALHDSVTFGEELLPVVDAAGDTYYIQLDADGALPVHLPGGAVVKVALVDGLGIPVLNAAGDTVYLVPISDTGGGAAQYQLRCVRAGGSVTFILCDTSHRLPIDGNTFAESEDDGSGGRRVPLTRADASTVYLSLEEV